MTTATPERAAVIRNSLGVGVATGLYGTSFGAVAVASGLSVAQTCALSLVMFTGASQFAMVGVLAAGGTPIAASLTAVLLGSRNTLYGLRVGPLLGWTGVRRAGAAQIPIDESTAMAVNRPNRSLARVGFVATGVSIFVLWNLFTLIGRSPARRSATRAPTGSTPRSELPSWRSSGRDFPTGATRRSRWRPLRSHSDSYR